MSRSVQQAGALVRTAFTVYDSSNAPVTGLVNGDFTKLLAKNGVDDATVVTVSEIGGGRYQASFTPASTGSWYLLIRNATHNPRGWDEFFDVTTDGVLGYNTIASTLLDLADGIETGFTLKQTLRLIAAGICGKVSGAPLSPMFRNMPDTADRMASTCDASGNRTAVTLTP